MLSRILALLFPRPVPPGPDGPCRVLPPDGGIYRAEIDGAWAGRNQERLVRVEPEPAGRPSEILGPDRLGPALQAALPELSARLERTAARAIRKGSAAGLQALRAGRDALEGQMVPVANRAAVASFLDALSTRIEFAAMARLAVDPTLGRLVRASRTGPPGAQAGLPLPPGARYCVQLREDYRVVTVLVRRPANRPGYRLRTSNSQDTW